MIVTLPIITMFDGANNFFGGVINAASMIIASLPPAIERRLLVLCEDEDALSLQEKLREEGFSSSLIAVFSKGQEEKSNRSEDRAEDSNLSLEKGIIVSAENVDFIERLKLLTAGNGFPLVIVATARPEAIRLALGCAAVFGRIYLLSAPSGPVRVDLHSTINYKSLIVKGMGQRA